MRDLQRIIQAMSLPEFYPHKPGSVEVIQTHISVVFIAGDLVYKIKKPVNFGFLNFSSLTKRRHYCHQEVILNSRFSEGIYQGVVSIYKDQEGFNLEGRGDEIEVAVLMRRIPKDRIMVNMLERDLITPDMLDRLAHRLSELHRQARTSKTIASYGSIPVVYQNLRENFVQTERFIPQTISKKRYEEIARLAYAVLSDHADLFTERVQQGFIRDCHGDLRLDHVVFGEKIMLIDCIEFNDRFRFGDTASDLSFLLMDLDDKGYPGFSRRIQEQYAVASGDTDVVQLLPFYKSYRAFVRGKVHSFALEEPEISQADRAIHAERAKDYFSLSLAYLKPVPPPALIITCGFTGVGKSYIAAKAAQRLGIQVIRSDVLRKRLLGLFETEQRLDKYGAGIYTPSTTELIYQTMFQEAEQHLKRGDSIILDASFLKRSHRRQAAEIAQRCGAIFLIIQCAAPIEVVQQRLEKRMREKTDPSDGRWEIYLRQQEVFDAIQESELPYLRRWESGRNPKNFLEALVKELMFSHLSAEV
ncbi:MAG: AAA family ATPase [Desulfomonilaceae bacterium]